MYQEMSPSHPQGQSDSHEAPPIRSVKRKKLPDFHKGTNGPSIWMSSPKSLIHTERQKTPCYTHLTLLGSRIQNLIARGKFHSIKFGTDDSLVAKAVALLWPQHKPGTWVKTNAFDPLETTHHSNQAGFLPPCEEMLAQFISQEIDSLQPNRSCLVLVSDAIMEGLLDEEGFDKNNPLGAHYIYDLIFHFERRIPCSCTGAYIQRHT